MKFFRNLILSGRLHYFHKVVATHKHSIRRTHFTTTIFICFCEDAYFTSPEEYFTALLETGKRQKGEISRLSKENDNLKRKLDDKEDEYEDLQKEVELLRQTLVEKEDMIKKIEDERDDQEDDLIETKNDLRENELYIDEMHTLLEKALGSKRPRRA